MKKVFLTNVLKHLPPSDYKSRGFGITKTHLKHADRIERLILILTVALYWAVSTGMKPKPAVDTKKTVQIIDIPIQTRLTFHSKCRTFPRTYPPILWTFKHCVGR